MDPIIDHWLRHGGEVPIRDFQPETRAHLLAMHRIAHAAYLDLCLSQEAAFRLLGREDLTLEQRNRAERLERELQSLRHRLCEAWAPMLDVTKQAQQEEL